ncbi:MAG: hypothetical protein HY923_02715 [Elusimicrobia bacterium]|nr:hypothetical protein [Elusimicrobiota bacterium]
MRAAILAVLISAPAAAQSPMYGADASTATVSTSTDTVTSSTSTVSVSTSAPSIDDVAGHGFKIGGGAPKAKLTRPMHAVIHKDAVDWEPLSLREGGVPGGGETTIALKVVKVKGRMKGENSKAKAFARTHKGRKDGRWLVISLYPKSLESRRAHFEIRLRVVEGYVEQAEAAAVIVTERRRLDAPKRPRDSYDLREEGIEYREEMPGSGQLVIAELDPRPGAAAVNSGRLEKAEFADSDIGFVNLSWATRGLPAK